MMFFTKKRKKGAAVIAQGGGAAAPSTPPAFDAASHNKTGTTGATTIDLTHTIGSGENRYIMVGSAQRVVTAIINSVVLDPGGANQASFTKLESGNGAGSMARGEYWYLVNPPSGTFTIRITYSATTRAAAGANSFLSVHQTIPHNTPATVYGQNSTSGTGIQNVASESGELIVDVCAKNDTTEGMTPKADQTLRFTDETANTFKSGNVIVGSTTKAGANPEDAGWDWSSASAREFVYIAASLKPA